MLAGELRLPQPVGTKGCQERRDTDVPGGALRDAPSQDPLVCGAGVNERQSDGGYQGESPRLECLIAANTFPGRNGAHLLAFPLGVFFPVRSARVR